MSTITEPHQSASARGLQLHLAGMAVATDTTCQLCGGAGAQPVIDLGRAPLLADVGDADRASDTVGYALRMVRCLRCNALQLDDTLDDQAQAQIATGVSERSFAGRPDLARRFCEDAIDRWGLRGDGHVIEIGSGTGSLLRFFRAWQLPVLGIEPDPQLTRYARLRRVPTWRAGFDAAIAGRIARADMHADLVIVSTPTGAFDDLRELFASVSTVLRPGGVMTLEVPDVLRIVGRTRVDEVTHPHRVIPTIGQLQRALTPFGLHVVDVERADLAGARLRVWMQHTPARSEVSPSTHPRLRTRMRAERAAQIDGGAATASFAHRARLVREQIVSLLDDARSQHCTVAATCADPPAVALANLIAMARSDVAYVVDDDPVRCGMALPGTDVPVITRDQATSWRPDLVLALGDEAGMPDTWQGVPVYVVSDLIDVVHRLTGAASPPDGDDAGLPEAQLAASADR